jgi:hypothetical protein
MQHLKWIFLNHVGTIQDEIFKVTNSNFILFLSNFSLKGLSHEIDFKKVVKNGQILALIRAAAGFLIFRRLL